MGDLTKPLPHVVTGLIEKRRGLPKGYPAQDLKGSLLWEIAENPQTALAYDVGARLMDKKLAHDAP